MRIESLHNLFTQTLSCLSAYDLRSGQTMAAIAVNVANPEFKALLDRGSAQSEERMRRLEACFELLDLETRIDESPATDGLLTECEEIAACAGDLDAIDAALIASVQAVTHYGIAWFGSARTWAGQLGQPEAADLLQQCLDEIVRLDRELTALAESAVNLRAR